MRLSQSAKANISKRYFRFKDVLTGRSCCPLESALDINIALIYIIKIVENDILALVSALTLIYGHQFFGILTRLWFIKANDANRHGPIYP